MASNTSNIQQQILKQAAHLIEAGWIKYNLARNNQGLFRLPIHKDACYFDLVGAIERATYEVAPTEHYEQLVEYVAKLVPGQNLTKWNDSPKRNKAEVVALLEAAAKLLGNQEMSKFISLLKTGKENHHDR